MADDEDDEGVEEVIQVGLGCMAAFHMHSSLVRTGRHIEAWAAVEETVWVVALALVGISSWEGLPRLSQRLLLE